MHITQIFVSDVKGGMGDYIEQAIDTVKDVFQGQHTLWDDETIQDFLDTEYDSEVLEAYRSLNSYAYKADLARYCILNSRGGWYVDCSMRAECCPQISDQISMVAFRSVQRYSFTNYACDNGLIYATVDHPVLETAIDLILQNVANKFYGVTPLCPTGPGLFGRAIAMEHKDGSIMFGDCMELTPLHQIKNKAFVSHHGEIITRGKPAHGGDLTQVGAKGVNNYNEIWHGRRVYS